MSKLRSFISALCAALKRVSPIFFFTLVVATLTVPVVILPWERREFIRWWQIELALYPSHVFLNHFSHFLGVGLPFLLAAGLTASLGLKYSFLVLLARGEPVSRACAAAFTISTLLLAAGVGLVMGYQLIAAVVLPSIPLASIGGPIVVLLTVLTTTPLILELLRSERFIGGVVRMVQEIPWPIGLAGLWLTSLAIYSWTMVEVIEPWILWVPPTVVLYFWIAHELVGALDRRFKTLQP